ncbi:MAG: hypothetical protein AAB552_00755 [Patescibacteria group bacterium]
MKDIYISSGLFARPSFVEGVSRVMDLGATLQEYNISETEQEADIKALKNDWQVVGGDLNFSIKTYEQGLAK